MIETERLLLREYKTEDFETVHAYGSDPDFSKYEFWGPNSEEDTKNFIADTIAKSQKDPRYEFDFAVCLKSTGRQFGGCGVRRETELSQVANLGWAIAPEFQNQGYATEAAKAVIEFGFEKLGLSVIYATCDTRNIASYKVMEKVGMKKVGFIKGSKEIKGHVRDSYRYEILKN